jgi:hypothetical protein
VFVSVPDFRRSGTDTNTDTYTDRGLGLGLGLGLGQTVRNLPNTHGPRIL